jgi:PAS domain S-box-containing protein
MKYTALKKAELIDELNRMRKENLRLSRDLDIQKARRSEKEEHYKNLFDNATIGIYRTSADGRILEANKKLIELLGFDNFDDLSQRDLSKEGFESSYPRADFLKKLKTEGEIIGLESAWTTSCGETIYVRESAKAYFDDRGDLRYIEGSVEDITKRKMAEIELEEGKEYIQKVADYTATLIYIYDLKKDRNIYSNQGIKTILGYDSEQIQAMGEDMIPSLIHPDDIQVVRSNLQRLDKAAPGEAVESEYRMKHADGEYRWLFCREVVFKYDEEGRPLQVLGNVIDITERRTFEDELKQTRDLLRKVLNLVPHHIHAKTEDSTFIIANKSVAESFGMEPEELIGKKHSDLAANKEEMRQMLRDDREVIESGHFKFIPIEAYTDVYGQFHWLQTTKVPFEHNGQSAVMVLAIDITDLKNAEDALKESEEIYRAIIQQSADGIVIADDRARVIEWSRGMEKITGVAKEDILGAPIWDTQHNLLPVNIKNPEEKVENIKRIKELYAKGSADWLGKQIEGVIERPDGEKRYVETLTYTIRSRDRMLIGSIVRDNTEQYYIEKRIKDEHEQLLSIFDSIDTPIYITDMNTYEILYVNNNIQDLYGNVMIGGKCYEQIYNLSEPCEFCRYDKLKEMRGDTMRWEVKNTYLNRDFIVIERMIKWPDDGDVKLSVLIDITDRKEMEQLLRQSEKQMKEAIDAKDKFFSIMAHDLKSPLGGFMGLLSRDYNSMTIEEIQEMSYALNESAAHLFKLLENLLEWSRVQRGKINYEPKFINVNHILNECVTLFESVAEQKNIEIISNVSSSYFIYADGRMMETVCRNILSNALKFTPSGGKVTISITEYINDQLLFRIKDTGVGMSEDKISRLFHIGEDISTTGTDNEKGTGLGLILCKELVEINHGRIWVESTPGKGTTFYIALPTKPVV